MSEKNTEANQSPTPDQVYAKKTFWITIAFVVLYTGTVITFIL